jgi:hypothetical protein
MRRLLAAYSIENEAHVDAFQIRGRRVVAPERSYVDLDMAQLDALVSGCTLDQRDTAGGDTNHERLARGDFLANSRAVENEVMVPDLVQTPLKCTATRGSGSVPGLLICHDDLISTQLNDSIDLSDLDSIASIERRISGHRDSF